MINLQDENIGWKHSVPGGPCFSFPFQISVCFYTILQTTKPGPLKNFRISYMTIRATHLHAKFGVDSTYPGKVWIYGIVVKWQHNFLDISRIEKFSYVGRKNQVKSRSGWKRCSGFTASKGMFIISLYFWNLSRFYYSINSAKYY